jgi:Flp pilus assembly protein TadD
MRLHLRIWLIAIFCALMAGLAWYAREEGRVPSVPGLSQPEREQLERMLSSLESDPLARRLETRQIVQEVARWTEMGRLDTAESQYALALDYQDRKAFTSAEHAFRRAATLRPEWSWPQNGLGILLAAHAQGHQKEAEELFRKAIALDPEWWRPHNDLAVLYRNQKRLTEAEAEAQEALRLAPDELAPNNNYGNLLITMNRLDEAEPLFLRAIELDPEHAKPYYNLACLYCLKKEPEKALEYVQKAVALNSALRTEAARDKDLSCLRGEKTFTELIRAKRKSK